MKNYRITVNGVEYEVQVEEIGAEEMTQTAAPARKAAAPAAPAKKAPAKAAGAEGNVKVTSPMPGKIIAVKANVGDTVKKGDVVVVLEAMKMENEIGATEDGVIASVNVATGDMVESGALLVTLNN